ncbi:MAG: DUF418 domain-containing protein [Planctomycetota bacterium]|nr:DUF418 domain-containing protein [Planctomycetota bacterium]
MADGIERGEAGAAAEAVPAAPVSQTLRFDSIDVLRGFALLGILAMNIMVFAMPMAAYSNPTFGPEYSGVNRATYWVVHALFDLKMMGLFSMLFGAGVVIWSRKAETREEVVRLRWLWIRRMGWLLVFGMIHAWIIWFGDILVAYALCGVLVVWWLRRLPPVWLIVVAGAFFGVHLLLMAGQGFQAWKLFSDAPSAIDMRASMTPDELEAGRLQMQVHMSPTVEQYAHELGTMRGSWMEIFERRAEMTLMMQVWAFAFFIFWRVSAMMLLGVALTKLGVLTGERSAKFYAGLAVAGYLVGLPIVIGGILYNESHGFELAKFAGLGMGFNAVGAVPVMLGHVGLVVWIVKRGVLRPVTTALARVGQMAFTNYLMQSVLGSLIFYGFGFGLAGELNRLGQQGVVWFIWAVQILWSVAWLSRFRFGPAEWLWRSLTYWKLQPMRRLPAAAGAPAAGAASG